MEKTRTSYKTVGTIYGNDKTGLLRVKTIRRNRPNSQLVVNILGLELNYELSLTSSVMPTVMQPSKREYCRSILKISKKPTAAEKCYYTLTQLLTNTKSYIQ